MFSLAGAGVGYGCYHCKASNLSHFNRCLILAPGILGLITDIALGFIAMELGVAGYFGMVSFIHMPKVASILVGATGATYLTLATYTGAFTNLLTIGLIYQKTPCGWVTGKIFEDSSDDDDF